MYSGSTLTKHSGRFLGAHQKIDRVARQQLGKVLGKKKVNFPTAKAILHFEGVNGPDAIKRKSPAQSEPWHYYNPFDENDTQLLDLIASHYKSLAGALKESNAARAAFEAAWLAHAIVDGLTPAHHFPYEEALVALRGGEGIEERTTIKKKLVMPGATRRESLRNNWKMWGPKGLMSTHGSFELGVATLILPLSLTRAKPTAAELAEAAELGIVEYFKRTAKEVGAMGLYDKFYLKGWTAALARQIRTQLAPAITKTVTLAWYCAYQTAQEE